jgi:hypothetical protein
VMVSPTDLKVDGFALMLKRELALPVTLSLPQLRAAIDKAAMARTTGTGIFMEHSFYSSCDKAPFITINWNAVFYISCQRSMIRGFAFSSPALSPNYLNVSVHED